MGPTPSGVGPFLFLSPRSMEPELLIRAIKALLEVAGFAYLGQGLVAIFAGARRESNVVFQIFRIITSPVARVVRFVTPRFVPDRHIPFVAFGLLLWAWILCLVALARLKSGA